MGDSVNIVNIDFNKLIDTTNETILKIFELVKLREWDKLIEIIKSTDIDLNIKDNSGMWLIEYAILFNQNKLIDAMLEKNIRIDITDDNSKSILYNVIKFSYTDILLKLLEKNKTTIGKSILEIKDTNQNIPLFYAIKLFNIECVKIILDYTNNFYISNSDGDNALHLAIKSQNFEIFELVSNYFNNYTKSRNANGESYLHLIIKLKCYNMLEKFINKIKTDPNIKEILNYVEFKYNFTILHYICVGLDFVSIEILYKLGVLDLIDGNIQDNSGNIFYHYFINNIINFKSITTDLEKNILNANKLFSNIKWNINIYNIDGNTPGHIFYSNINFFSKSNLNILINWIGENIDMNIQNFKGESILYLVVKNGYWKNISNILINKKLDIFIIVDGKETIFDYLEKNDYEYFLDIITQSYLNQLASNSSSSKWIEYWDNRCKKIVKLSELNETELELLLNLDIIKPNSKSNSNENICYQIIKNKLDKAIEIFIQTKNAFEVSSYPQAHKFTKLISKYPNIVVSTFSGSTIDVLVGMIYLLNKFNKKENSYYIKSTIDILKTKSDIIVCHPTTNSYPSEQIVGTNETNRTNGSHGLNPNSHNSICEIEGFEIMWINKNIIFPIQHDISINSILKWMVENKSHGCRWFIVPIGIEFNSFSHANYLIIDIEMMEIERFEPHGAYAPTGYNYVPELLDTLISNYIGESGLKFKYFKPIDYLPKIGFQTIEINELKADYIGDPNGFCALWCIWWTDMRLSNPNITRTKLIKLLTKELINNKYSYKKLIRDYSYYIVDLRDKLFIKANTNINEWLNDIIGQKNIELLNTILMDNITSI